MKLLTKLGIEIIESRLDGMELVEALSNYLSQLGVRAKLSMEIEIEPVALALPHTHQINTIPPLKPLTMSDRGMNADITPVPELSEMEGMFNKPVVKVMSFADVIKADKNAPSMIDEDGDPTSEQEVIFHGSEGRIRKRYPDAD